MPFPQIIEANLEAFILQAKRVHERLCKIKALHNGHRSFRHLPVVRLYETVTRSVRHAFAGMLSLPG